MWARRVQRYTRVCANAASPQATKDRRRFLRTKFTTLPGMQHNWVAGACPALIPYPSGTAKKTKEY